MTARYRLLDLDIDVPRQQVSRAGQALDVSGLSFQLFAYLLAQGQRVVGFDELIQAVWAPAVVGEETVTQRIKLLRQALGDDARRPRYLRSVRGQGYQLADLPQVLEAPTQPAPSWPHRASRWYLGAGVGLAIVVAAAGLAWRQVHAPAASPLLERARYYAGIGQADNNDRAIALYRQALAHSPDSAAALAGLSRALSARTCLYNGDAAEAQQGAALARQLLRMRGEDAVAWAALGYAQDCLGDMGAAVAGYEAAIRLDPADDKSRASLAYLYQEQGRLAEALQGNFAVRHPQHVRFGEVQVARELALLGFSAAAERRLKANFELFPDNVFANIAWPHFLLSQGRTDEAAAALKIALVRGTPHPALSRLQGELALLQGDRDGASAAFAAGQRLRPHQSLPATLAGLYAPHPPSDAWLQERLQRLKGDAPGWPDAALEAALLEQQRGDAQAALKSLHAAVSAGFRDRAWLVATPLFAEMRKAPGFSALLARIDLDLAAQRKQVAQADWRPRDLQ
ncbi:MAG TPA: winged helix-turn-helix domain-containing protein [Stenotrophomonas sp.]|nr:winged helix-turn-helix domain-containing protein [Stenotrophomonas sp.]